MRSHSIPVHNAQRTSTAVRESRPHPLFIARGARRGTPLPTLSAWWERLGAEHRSKCVRL